MFDAHTLPALQAPHAAQAAAGNARPVAPPSLEPVAAQLCQIVIDQLGFGVALLDAQGRLLLANQAARRELARRRTLGLEGRRLQFIAADAAVPALRHQATLQHAVDAAGRGLRQLVTLGAGAARVSLMLLPMPAPDGTPLVLALFSRRQLCHPLVAEMYARSCGMTAAEGGVLRGLAEGLEPGEIAERGGVKLSTVRTQLAQVRGKADADGIHGLLHELGRLPPGSAALVECG